MSDDMFSLPEPPAEPQGRGIKTEKNRVLWVIAFLIIASLAYDVYRRERAKEDPLRDQFFVAVIQQDVVPGKREYKSNLAAHQACPYYPNL